MAKSDAAVTAFALRKQLRQDFPEVNFSVVAKSYSGGNSITVRWVDGPIMPLVDEVVKQYQQCEFDGMQDMEIYHGIDAAKLGCPGVHYTFSSREISAARQTEIADYVKARFGEIPDHLRDRWSETGCNARKAEISFPECWSALNQERYAAMQQRQAEQQEQPLVEAPADDSSERAKQILEELGWLLDEGQNPPAPQKQNEPQKHSRDRVPAIE